MTVRHPMADTGRVTSEADAPAHAARPPQRRMRLAGAVAGIAAIVAAVAVAVPTLQGDPAPVAETLTTARSLTVTIAPAVIPMSDAELAALLDRPADLGALQQPGRLGSCLGGLGYPTSTAILGAETVDINGRASVVLLVGAENPRLITVLAVDTQCSAADTGLLADTVIPRP